MQPTSTATSLSTDTGAQVDIPKPTSTSTDTGTLINLPTLTSTPTVPDPAVQQVAFASTDTPVPSVTITTPDTARAQDAPPELPICTTVEGTQVAQTMISMQTYPTITGTAKRGVTPTATPTLPPIRLLQCLTATFAMTDTPTFTANRVGTSTSAARRTQTQAAAFATATYRIANYTRPAPTRVPVTRAPASPRPTLPPLPAGPTSPLNPTAPPPPPSGATCPNTSSTCSQLTCQQAYACLAAGNKSLDRDHDGVPCESICPGG